MAKKLTVILGAGASHSLNPDRKNLDNEAYRPPLAADMFRQSGQFLTILHKYPLAEILASDINRRIKQNNPGIGLEQILKSYEEKMSEGTKSITSHQFLQVPLYLNTLFGEITTHFTKQPDEYNNLVTSVLDSVNEVLFLTLNYDNLLEIPLSEIFGIDFANEEQYINNKRWALVKLHGSTNWYKSFSAIQHQTPTDDNYYLLLKTTTLPLSLEEGFDILGMRKHSVKYIGQTPVYPAITVPVDDKYLINCPASHEQAAKSFLSECHNYLIIGTSGKDQDLLDMLKTNAKGGQIMVVDKNKKCAVKVSENIMLAVPQFQQNINIYSQEGGFAEFVGSGKLEEYLNSLV